MGKLFDKKNRAYWFLFFAFLFSIQSLPRIWRESPIADEDWEVTTGYYYWLKGDVVSFNNQPPLAGALQAFPLLFLDLKVEPRFRDMPVDARIRNVSEDRAYSFFYVSNLDKLDRVIAWPRVITLLFALGTGFLLFLLVRGSVPVVFLGTLLLWAFEPTFLAYSTVAKPDIPLTFLSLAGLLAFRKGQEKRSAGWDLLAGGLAGSAMTTKLTAWAILPLYLAMDLWEAWKRPGSREGWAIRWFRGIFAFTLVVSLVYLPGTLRLADHRSPLVYFYYRIQERLWLARHEDYSTVFFLGHLLSRHEVWHTFVTLVLKSTIPSTLLMALGLLLAFLRKILVPAWVWSFSFGWMILLESSPRVFLRYELPAYPGWILLAALAGGWLWEKGRSRDVRSLRWLVLFLGAWQVLSVAGTFLNPLGYFNDLVPSGKRSGLLGQGGLDLGQDLRDLGRVARERGWTQVKLAYIGQDDPYYYGLPIWEPWTLRDLTAPQPGTVYLIQAGFLLENPPEIERAFPVRESWVARSKPTGEVGGAWLYFETPGKREKEAPSQILSSVPYLVYGNAPYRNKRSADPP